MEHDPLGIVYLDGELMPRSRAAVPVGSQAVRFGMSLFETLSTAGPCPLFIEAHCARLAESARFLGIRLPLRTREIASAAAGLVRENGSPESARLRITLLAGSLSQGKDWSYPPEDSSLVMELTPFSPPRAGDPGAGVHALISSFKRPDGWIPAMHKTGNYLANLMDRRKATEAGCGECIALSADGKPLEGTASNLFAAIGDRVLTPPLTRPVLPGITRAQLLAKERFAGAKVMEGEFSLSELRDAREAFLTNSLAGAVPLLSLNGRPIGSGKPGPIAIAAEAFLAEIKRQYIASMSR